MNHCLLISKIDIFLTRYLLFLQKGQLWPNKVTEITITFFPKEVGEFEATAYLDIDGVSSRVPLKMVGISLPPSINLNLETLDMDCVYINKKYNYEVVAINKGTYLLLVVLL